MWSLVTVCVVDTHYNIVGASRHRDHQIASIKSQAPNHDQRPPALIDGLRLLSTEDTSTTQVPVTIVRMADNLCGPSAPTKGLVGHLDRDRTLQQDRAAGSPASAAGVSCTSRLFLLGNEADLYSLSDQLPKGRPIQLLEMRLSPNSLVPRLRPILNPLPLLQPKSDHGETPITTPSFGCSTSTAFVAMLTSPWTAGTKSILRTMSTRPFLTVAVEWTISAQVQLCRQPILPGSMTFDVLKRKIL